MKILYKAGGVTVGILNDKNYVVVRNGKELYYSNIQSALRECCRLLANDSGKDIGTWVQSYCRHLQLAERAFVEATGVAG